MANSDQNVTPTLKATGNANAANLKKIFHIKSSDEYLIIYMSMTFNNFRFLHVILDTANEWSLLRRDLIWTDKVIK